MSTRRVMVTPKRPKEATFAYGLHPRQRLDAYWTAVPQVTRQVQGELGRVGGQAPPAPRPAVLLFHGGSWVTGDKVSWKYFARRLTAQGFTVFSANYRLSTQAAWPAQRNDALAALAYVRRNAAKWNVDPDRVVAFGSSAGGLLAGQLATYGEGGTRVRGALSLSPVNVPYQAYQDGLKPDASAGQRALRRAVVQLLDCKPAGADALCAKQVDDSDTTTHASAGDAPMLLMHFNDELVPSSQSTGLARALRDVGVGATVRTVEGRGHASQLLYDESVFASVVSWLKARTS